MKMTKSFSGGFSPVTPTKCYAPGPRWGLRPRRLFRLTLCALTMVCPWQILDPPLSPYTLPFPKIGVRKFATPSKNPF